ncbi:oxidoreductase [Collimonas sp.]|uniref:oxidoreductase n=1 Tax=Collimonas sp. TaxID=1963772 RepID=UPI002BAEC39A|nr:oxidoreductase [Collimonas sp.]HWW99596.1 oxidoreductase [Collimonas sp.]
MSKVWLITGSARGLGLHIAEAVLAAGHRLVATARDISRLSDLQARYGEQVRIAALDVTDAKAAQAAVQLALSAFGRLDVLVNNAGFGHLAPFEQTADEDFRAQIDANFYGVVNLTRAVLPTMRAQRSGHIINISSVGGRTGTPGLSAYQSAKWAVGGFTEVLAQEVTPLGIKVISLEPGGMRTDWADIAGSRLPELLADYQPTVGRLAEMLAAYAGKAAGDPAKVAQVVLGIAAHDNPPAHLLLGSDALHYFGAAEAVRNSDAAAWRTVSVATDVDADAPLPPFPVSEVE